MIKDGKRIISRDTKGYKVILNRIVKEFSKCTLAGILEIDVVIQKSKNASKNQKGLNYRTTGRAFLQKRTIHIYYQNCINMDDVLETLAHEFGHMRQFYTRYAEFKKQTPLQWEKFADDYSKKIMKRNVTKSQTGKVRSIAAMKRSR